MQDFLDRLKLASDHAPHFGYTRKDLKTIRKRYGGLGSVIYMCFQIIKVSIVYEK